MSTQSPTVSIVICTHNYGCYLEDALNSAAAQTHACEIVVVDDGSTDDTPSILERWRDRAVLVRRERGGQRAAYETGLNHSTGEYVIFLDADDKLDATAVSQIVHAFTPDVVKVHYRMRLVDAADRPLGPAIPSRLARGELASDLKRRGLMYASAPGSGNAYRRSAIEPLFPLPINPNDVHGADFFLIYGCIFAGNVAAIDAVLGSYRVHDSGVTSRHALVFGNSAHALDPQASFESRVSQLREWLLARLDIHLPSKILDFSQQKTIFVRRVFDRSYLHGLMQGGSRLPDLLPAVWDARALSSAQKAALSAWAVAVLVLPRPLGHPIARYVSNPVSR